MTTATLDFSSYSIQWGKVSTVCTVHLELEILCSSAVHRQCIIKFTLLPKDSEFLPKVCYYRPKNSEILSKLWNSESAGGSGWQERVHCIGKGSSVTRKIQWHWKRQRTDKDSMATIGIASNAHLALVVARLAWRLAWRLCFGRLCFGLRHCVAVCRHLWSLLGCFRLCCFLGKEVLDVALTRVTSLGRARPCPGHCESAKQLWGKYGQLNWDF